jgi:hypothetical protein
MPGFQPQNDLLAKTSVRSKLVFQQNRPVADGHDGPLRRSLLIACSPASSGAKRFSEFMIGEVEVVPEVVDERRPFVRIDVITAVQ